MTKISPPVNKAIETETEITCFRCGGKFSYGVNDISEYNTVQCPWCHRETELNCLSRKFALFPNDFFHYSKDNSVTLSREKTQKYINEALDEENNLHSGDFYYTSTADTCVIALKFDNEFRIIVAKDFYETSKDYE